MKSNMFGGYKKVKKKIDKNKNNIFYFIWFIIFV